MRGVIYARGRGQHKRCHYCGTRLSRRNTSVDHLRPLSRGGSDRAHNKVDACLNCNRDKGCLGVEEFRLVLAFRQGLIGKAKMRFYGETNGALS